MCCGAGVEIEELNCCEAVALWPNIKVGIKKVEKKKVEKNETVNFDLFAIASESWARAAGPSIRRGDYK